MVETSKGAVALMVIGESRFVPLTVNDCGAEAVPLVVEKGARMPPRLIVGASGSMTVPESGMVTGAASREVSVRLPENSPAAATSFI